MFVFIQYNPKIMNLNKHWKTININHSQCCWRTFPLTSSLSLPHSFCRRPSVVQRVEVLFGAELANFIHPMAGQRGRTHHQRGHGATVCGLCLGIFLCPEQTSNRQMSQVLRGGATWWHHKYIEAGFPIWYSASVMRKFEASGAQTLTGLCWSRRHLDWRR